MTCDWKNEHPPSIADLELLMQQAVEGLPAQFRTFAQSIAFSVEDLPADELLAELEVDEPYGLTGYYSGIPLTEKSSAHQETEADRIVLFRLPILDEWIERGNVSLGELVANVLVHELAHHLGYSDENIAAIDRWWE